METDPLARWSPGDTGDERGGQLAHDQGPEEIHLIFAFDPGRDEDVDRRWTHEAVAVALFTRSKSSMKKAAEVNRLLPGPGKVYSRRGESCE